MARNLYFIGTAGSGKSTMVRGFHEWMEGQGLDAVTVNLDPGADRVPYDVDIDVRDWIRLGDVMQEHGLGPNGAQVLAADLLAVNAGELRDVMETFRTNYFLIDTPGQMELFTFRESSRVVIDAFGREDGALVYLNDPALVRSPSGLISSVLLSAIAQFRHVLPFVNVLSKADILTPEELEKVVAWSADPLELYEALMTDTTTPKTLLDVEFMRGMDTIGVYRRLMAVSSESMSGFEDVYTQIQNVFEGGEDLRPD